VEPFLLPPIRLGGGSTFPARQIDHLQPDPHDAADPEHDRRQPRPVLQPVRRSTGRSTSPRGRRIIPYATISEPSPNPSDTAVDRIETRPATIATMATTGVITLVQVATANGIVPTARAT